MKKGIDFTSIFERIEKEEINKKKNTNKIASKEINYNEIQTLDEFLEKEYQNEIIEEDDEYEEFECLIEDKVVKFPMSSDEKNMKNKKCDYKTLAIMTLYSKREPNSKEKYRYIYANDIMENKEEFEKISKNKIKSVRRSIKKLSMLESEIIKVEESENGIVYKIGYTTKNEKENGEITYRKYVLIEEKILRFLVDGGSSNLIKTYIYLKYRCKEDKELGTRITAKEIANNIGLSPKCNNNLQTVYNIIEWLEAIQLIKVNRKQFVGKEDNGKLHSRKHNFYNIVKYDEWLNLRKK